MRLNRPLALLVLALFATPVLAYTIYLKDGSRLVAQEKYVIDGDQAVIVLPSGTLSMIAASEIDVERTEEANQSRLSGTAMVIEGGFVTDIKETAPPPKRVTLQDKIRSNEAGMRPAPARMPVVSAPRTGTSSSRKGQAFERALYPNTGLATDILGFAAARGVSGLAVYRGETAKRPLLVFATGSEGSVFKALVVSSNALLFMQNTRPGTMDAFEVLCETDDGASAGRFILTSQLAADLVAGHYEITRFYVDNVIF